MSDSMPCPKPGQFSWNELVTTKTAESAKFYEQLFGWTAAPFVPKGAAAGGPPYMLFKTDAENDMGVGGMVAPMHPEAPTHWMPYVVVADADASLAKAVELGAFTIVPVMSVGDVGRIAVIKDPQGAVIGLHEFPKQNG
jgi:predicted enzyme related to lactoylglutathione lyase